MKNLETTIYTISFLIGVANSSNDQRIGWPLWKEASTTLESTQPALESANKFPVTTAFVSTSEFQSHPPLSQPLLKSVHSVPAVSKPSTQPVSKWAITFHWSSFGPGRLKAK